MSPASIFATKLVVTKVSISLKAIVRTDPIARLSPRSIPPYPAHREICVSSLVLSTLQTFLGYFLLCILYDYTFYSSFIEVSFVYFSTVKGKKKKK